ncbi:MAG: hypothetical protein IMY67_11885 [Bacteroidetes bacterium]|nr:hypothetical protein [Bacteroidota bacterium]
MLSIIMLVLSLISFSIGLYLGIKYEYKWFGNFGSLVVLFGVVSEYSLIQLELKSLYQALIGQGATVAGNEGIPDLSPNKFHSFLALLSHIVIIVGTLIWGFGEWLLT